MIARWPGVEPATFRLRVRCPTTAPPRTGEHMNGTTTGSSSFCYQLCALMYRCLNGTAPQYLAETLQKSADVEVCQRLWSIATPMLIMPSTHRSTLSDRAFPVAAAHAWNAPPSSVRAETSLQSFSLDVKTILFAAVTDSVL